MNPTTIVSARGQIVLPQNVRQRLGWERGLGLEIIEHAGSVTLRPRLQRDTITVDELVERLRAINPNPGPFVSDAEIDAILVETAAQADAGP